MTKSGSKAFPASRAAEDVQAPQLEQGYGCHRTVAVYLAPLVLFHPPQTSSFPLPFLFPSPTICRDAMCRRHNLSKAMVVVGPPDKDDHCYVVALRAKEAQGVMQVGTQVWGCGRLVVVWDVAGMQHRGVGWCNKEWLVVETDFTERLVE